MSTYNRAYLGHTWFLAAARISPGSRLATQLTALAILAIGIDPYRPWWCPRWSSASASRPLWLLVQLAASQTVRGDLVNGRRTTLLAVLVATAVSTLNVVPWS
ncbi:MAG: hypothetical protein ACRDP9_04575 [Kribbellaceae bacterium]